MSYSAENLFHYKLNQTRYSIKPEDYQKLPLFVESQDSSTYVNEFFFLVYSRFTSWQNMKSLAVATLQDTRLWRTNYIALPRTNSGPAMESTPVVSKRMVAYLASFLGVAPFSRTLDPRVDIRLDKGYANAMTRLSAVAGDAYTTYMSRKMLAWYRRFPPKDVSDHTEETFIPEQGAPPVVEGEGAALVASDGE